LGGTIINADIARFLVPEFLKWSGRIRHTLSTGEPAGAYAHARILRELKARAKRRELLITAGGAGSGKTTSLEQAREGADLVFDNQFRHFARAEEVLKVAIAAGWRVQVIYVHRPFDDVVRAVIDRSQRTGRWNRLSELPKMHLEAQRTIVRLFDQFAHQAAFHAIYNAQAGVGDRPRGARVFLREFRPGGVYHHADASTLAQLIRPVLRTALKDGLACKEVARLIGKDYL
jgi:hypothetical protein